MSEIENTSIPTEDVMLTGLVSRKDNAGDSFNSYGITHNEFILMGAIIY